MPFSAPIRLAAAVLAVATLTACANAEKAATNQNVAASGGEIAARPAAAGMSGLTDSISTRADLGRIRGASDATVWLVEISDFQCPYCKQWHDESFAAIDKEFVQTGKIKLAYLNFPIASLHPNARAASEAAMCASVQGKFWELHSSLFITQKMWANAPDPLPMFDTLAVEAKVNAKEWRSCMSSHATTAIIDADRERASAAGVQSTPTFFIGDRKFEGAYPVDSFRTIINQALAKARGGR